MRYFENISGADRNDDVFRTNPVLEIFDRFLHQRVGDGLGPVTQVQKAPDGRHFGDQHADVTRQAAEFWEIVIGFDAVKLVRDDVKHDVRLRLGRDEGYAHHALATVDSHGGHEGLRLLPQNRDEDRIGN